MGVVPLLRRMAQLMSVWVLAWIRRLGGAIGGSAIMGGGAIAGGAIGKGAIEGGGTLVMVPQQSPFERRLLRYAGFEWDSSIQQVT